MIYSIYNLWTDEVDIEIFPGEDLCPWCEGTGVRRVSENVVAEFPYLMCRKCKGRGKVDWISKVMK